MSKYYLYVEMVDWCGAYHNCVNLGEATPVNRRVVRIELTPQQIELLTSRKTGQIGNKDIFEEYRLICLQEEKEAADD